MARTHTIHEYWCNQFKWHFLAVGNVSGLRPSRTAGTDKQAQGCAGEGLKPEGLSPRVRARVLAVTGEMALFD